MIVEMARELPKPHAVIVGEPSSMRVINAHKGMTGMETIVTGHEAHSSQTHRGVSAVMTAARLITFLDDMAQEKAAGPHSTDGFEPPYTSIHVGVVLAAQRPTSSVASVDLTGTCETCRKTATKTYWIASTITVTRYCLR